ncbi:hypothetical protein ACLOAU_14565 [Niabella sp. CJ426]|uniref:hypothetical protein n=1 Tax=Niabella sp. CJ426 TaxID=3393740 RepID=UPI003D0217AD
MDKELLQKVKDEYAKSYAIQFKTQVSSEGVDNIESDFKAGWEAAEAYNAKQSQKDHLGELIKIDEGKEDQLHPDSSNLLKHCFEELRLKMIKNQEKYGYGNEWLTEEWEQECRDNMMEHIQKGDPRDVAIYALFMMYRGWSTKSEPNTGEQCFTNDDMHDFVGSYQRLDEDVWSIVDRMNYMAAAYAASQNRKLIAWKESAMKILSAVDDQEIGKLLGVPIGHSIHENLLEKIREYGDMRAKKALETFSKEYELTVGGSLMMRIRINESGVEVVGAIDGYGHSIADEISVEEITDPKNLEV